MLNNRHITAKALAFVARHRCVFKWENRRQTYMREDCIIDQTAQD
jgi:hypothetical protein